MILTPKNCTNPQFWGKELKMVVDGKVIEDKLEVPNEIDFIQTLFPKDTEGAREYFKL